MARATGGLVMINELSYVPWSNVYSAQRAIHKWANETFPGRDPVASLTKLVMEEIPELLQHKKQHGTDHIGEELADCFILLLDLAAIWNVDLPVAIRNKMYKNASRQWAKDHATGLYNHVEKP
jgi:NTP pyrophosphatase (non-canonical NTP hydrolase)